MSLFCHALMTRLNWVLGVVTAKTPWWPCIQNSHGAITRIEAMTTAPRRKDTPPPTRGHTTAGGGAGGGRAPPRAPPPGPAFLPRPLSPAVAAAPASPTPPSPPRAPPATSAAPRPSGG